LIKIKDNSAITPLVDFLKKLHWSDSKSINYTFNCLAEFGNAAVEPLIALVQDKDNLLRRDAIKVLAKIKDPRAVEPLIYYKMRT